MPVRIEPIHLRHLAPNARSSYREAFQNGQDILDATGIAGTPRRVAHFMAQVLHESGGLVLQFENLNYSAPRLSVVFPTRFKPKGPLDPARFEHDPQKLGNEVYGRRMGNTEPNDGFTYRGRGLLQLTGKDNYREVTQLLRGRYADAPDLLRSPDEVISARWCVRVAAVKWEARGCNALADAGDIRRVTRAINGGLIGIGDRTEWLRRTTAVWP